jgi:hypothetical protein
MVLLYPRKGILIFKGTPCLAARWEKAPWKAGASIGNRDLGNIKIIFDRVTMPSGKKLSTVA